MTKTPDSEARPEDGERQTMGDTAASRGTDERRQPVDPAQNPAPHSPEPDREAIAEAEETLERVKPYGAGRRPAARI